MKTLTMEKYSELWSRLLEAWANQNRWDLLHGTAIPLAVLRDRWTDWAERQAWIHLVGIMPVIVYPDGTAEGVIA